jgi:hypothetical protein
VALVGDFEGGDGPDRRRLTQVVRAGGATVVQAKQADVAVVAAPSAAAARPSRLPKGLACARVEYIVEWLAFPAKQPLAEHLLWGSCPSEALLAAERERSVRPGR